MISHNNNNKQGIIPYDFDILEMSSKILISVLIANSMKLFIIEGSESKLLAELTGNIDEEYYCVKFGIL